MNALMVCLVAGAFVATVSAQQPCPPNFRGTYPNCSADAYLPELPKVEHCPAGTVGYPPHCHIPCPAYQRRNNEGVCVGIPCPANTNGTFQPHCTYNHCPHGLVGIWPDCHPYVARPYCTNGTIGSYPDCYVPCPAYHHGRDGNCTRVRCPTGEGWVGEYQPDCVFTPKCPKEKPGTWPNCIGYYCPSDSIGSYPDCKCRPPKIGTPGECRNPEVVVTPRPVGPTKPTKPAQPKTPKPDNTYLPAN